MDYQISINSHSQNIISQSISSSLMSCNIYLNPMHYTSMNYSISYEHHSQITIYSNTPNSLCSSLLSIYPLAPLSHQNNLEFSTLLDPLDAKMDTRINAFLLMLLSSCTSLKNLIVSPTSTSNHSQPRFISLYT